MTIDPTTARPEPPLTAREVTPLDLLWIAMWEDLRHNATGRPTGLAIIARYRPQIEAAALRSQRDTEPLREAARQFAAHVTAQGCDHDRSGAGSHTSCAERLAFDAALGGEEPDGR